MATHGTSGLPTVRGAQSAGEEVARSTLFEWTSRAGFVARGVIYGIIGILALELALGAGGKVTDQQGALKTIAHQPFGEILLILVAIGLGGYAVWRFVRAALGHGPESSDSGFDRVAALASGVVYAGLCFVAVKVLLNDKASSSGNPHKAAAGVLGWPAGTWLVGIAGAIMFGVGLYQGYRGLSKDFLHDSKTEEMKPAERTWICRLGVFGHLARMVVFCLVGVFLVKAALDYDPSAAIGLDGALAKIVNASYGPWLLAIVACGLIAFALYSVSDARYRRI
jgi:uncharacterized protein DUF1206